jgi:glutamyl-tRNA reductase
MVDLERLSGARPDEEALASVESVHKLIEDEVAAFLAAGRAAMVAPALTAMRAAAADTAGAELDRLLRRVPHLDEQATKEISQSFQRVVDKVLHGPTVRARELAGAPEGARYVELLGALFEAKPTNKIEVVA